MTNLILIMIALPVFLLIYRLIPVRAQKPALIVGSLIYYCIWSELNLWAIGFIITSVIINYLLMRIMQHIHGRTGRIVFLWAEIALNLIPLITVKLLETSFMASTAAALPGGIIKIPGISFYTFTVLALHIDVYRSKVKTQVSLTDHLTFLLGFPKLAMGPITRYSEQSAAIDRLDKQHGLVSKHLRGGIKFFILGLGMKVLIADQLASVWTGICTSGTGGITWQTAWLGALTYSLELYLDFWGYSLIAIGLGRMTGVPVPANFDSPYQSKTVSEFWRRWHITLGQWFRDYIYIPLGGSRSGTPKMLLSLSVVWLITGLWHGLDVNFVIWGAVQGILVILEKTTPLGEIGTTKVAGHIYVVIVMLITWMIFAHTRADEMCSYIGCMFGIYPEGANPAQGQFARYIADHWYLYAAGIVACLPQTVTFVRYLHKKRWATIIYLLIFWASIYVMYSSASTPFMYAAF